MADEKELNLFVSSPSDVHGERERVDQVVERLNGEYAGRVRIKSIRWETSYYSSHETFQSQIPEASACDLVVAIFGARLGSPLPSGFPKMATGETYPSGSAYEVLSAIEARQHGRTVPDIYVFRRPQAPVVALDAPDRPEVEAQWARLKAFFETWFRNAQGEFIAAFQEFSSTDEFAAKIEDCLRQWLARRGFVARGEVWDRFSRGSPFPGLAAFDEDRQSVFFGRDLVVAQAIDRLRQSGKAEECGPFLLLIGASGSGKSSLMRAGLLPKMIRPGAIPAIDLWRKAIIVPSSDPFRALADGLFADQAFGPELRQGAFNTVDLLARQLAAEPDIAVAPLREAMDRASAVRQRQAGFARPRPSRLVIAIDQAERLFGETEGPVTARFAALLQALAQTRIATIIMALRSDAYARFQSFPPLVNLRDSGATLDLLPPNATELEEIVTRPAEICDPPLSFETSEGHSLASVLVADAKGGDALPLLQMTLSRLDAAQIARGDGMLRFADYRGMDAAVIETANEALASLDAAARAQLPALVTGLVRDVGADPTSGAALPVVGALDRVKFEAERPERRALIEAFVANRLLTAEGDGARQLVRPTHEALLRIWPQAVAIIHEAADLLRVRRILEPIVREWMDSPGADKARHLDVSPALLDGASRFVERFGDDVPQATRDFVAASAAVAKARQDREKQEQKRQVRDAQALAAASRRIAQRTGAGLAGALVLAGLAGWQWTVARAQRDRAEHTLALATDTASALVFDLAEKFRSTIGVPKSVIADILNKARGLQEQLLQSGQSTAKLNGNHAAALSELAQTEMALGETETALSLSRKAREIYAALVQQNPDNVANAHNLGLTDRGIGVILQRQGKFAEAEAAYKLAQVDAQLPAAKASKQDLVLVFPEELLMDFGALAQQRNDKDAALNFYRQAQALSQALVDSDPPDVLFRNALAAAGRSVGDILLARGDIENAAKAFDASRAIAEALMRDNPDNTDLKRDLAISDERLANVLSIKRDYAGALQAYEAGQAATVEMASKDPDNLDWQYDLAIGHAEIGGTQILLGRLDEAIDAYRQALAIDKRLTARDPSNALWRTHQWQMLINLGDALLKRGASGPAMEAYRDALNFATISAERGQDQAGWRENAALTQFKIAETLSTAHDDIQSLAAFREAASLARAFASLAQANPNLLRNASALNGDIGKALAKLNDYEGALAAMDASCVALRALVDRAPQNTEWRHDLAANRFFTATLLQIKRDLPGAIKARREAIGLYQALVDESPGNRDWRYDLAIAQDRLGFALAGSGDAESGMQAYRSSQENLEALVGSQTDNKPWRISLALLNVEIGDLLALRKNPDGALDAYQQALAKAPPASADADTDWLVLVAEANGKIGDVARAKGDLNAALAAFREAQRATKAQSRLDAANKPLRRELAVIDNKIGATLTAQGAGASAMTEYVESLALCRSLAESEPDNSLRQNDLAYTLAAIGDAHIVEHDRAGALKAFRESRDINLGLAAREPKKPLWKFNLVRADKSLGDVLLAGEDRDGALAAYLAALTNAAALVDLEPANANWSNLRAASVGSLAAVADQYILARAFQKALTTLDQAKPLAPRQIGPELLRAEALMFLNRADEAQQIFLRHRGETNLENRRWEILVAEQFARLRQAGLAHPQMSEIERLFAAGP